MGEVAAKASVSMYRCGSKVEALCQRVAEKMEGWQESEAEEEPEKARRSDFMLT